MKKRTVVCAGALALLMAVGCSTMPGLSGSRAMSRPAQLARAAGWPGAAPNAADAFRFVVMSDRTGGAMPGEWEQAVKDANLLKPDFVMCVGDLVEGYATNAVVLAGMMDEFETIVDKLDAPFFFCAGNHDVEQGKSPTTLMRDAYTCRHGVNGKTWYSFDYRRCHFLVLDSEALIEKPDLAKAQDVWLAEDLRRAAGARHVFVFYHHPFFPPDPQAPGAAEQQRIIDDWYGRFPKGKTTVFNGHWHELDYATVEGTPTYVIASTGAGTKNDRAAGDYHMIALVTVNDGDPAIAFVPLHEVQPAWTAEVAGFMRRGFTAAFNGLAVPAEGGSVGMTVANTGDAPLVLTLAVATNSAWRATPPTQTVTLPAASRRRVEFQAQPPAAAPTAGPEVTATLAWEGRDPVTLRSTLPVVRTGVLPRVPPMAIDGAKEKWAAVPATEIGAASQVFEGRDTWRGPADASAVLRVATDGSNLYVRVEVADDQVVADGRAPWSDADGFEFLWDVRPEGERNGSMEPGTGQFGLCPPAKDGPATGLNFVPAGRYGRPPPSGLRTLCQRTAAGYTVEFCVPGADLGLKPGHALDEAGVELFVDDKDGADPQTRLSISGVGIGWSNPGGYMRLRPAP